MNKTFIKGEKNPSLLNALFVPSISKSQADSFSFNELYRKFYSILMALVNFCKAILMVVFQQDYRNNLVYWKYAILNNLDCLMLPI